MMVKSPPDGAPIEEWFPWSCPECDLVWWYTPSARVGELPCCGAELAALESWSEEHKVRWVRSSRLDLWRRVMAVSLGMEGRRSALKSAMRIPHELKKSATYGAIFERVNSTLPKRLHIEIDLLDGEPLPGLPSWGCDPQTLCDDVSGLELSFQVKPESGARLLRVRSKDPLGGSCLFERNFMFTTEGELDGVA